MNIPHSYQVFTAEGSRMLDERTISEFGIDGFTLMEIAGTRAADVIMQNVSAKSHGLFVCGKGNNAGDALVVARLLCEQDINCTVLFVSGMMNLSKDCDENLNLLQNLGQDIEILSSFEEFDSSRTFDFIVDGMFGTGLSSDVRAPYTEVIDWINEQESTVFAMDIPSGLSSDSGEIMGTAVQADFTLAFGTLKFGFFLNSGYSHCGEVILCPLPFPSKLKDSTTFLMDEEWVIDIETSSTQRKHKYDGGVLYIVAGSEGLTGAAVLAAKSAWATGLGGVVLITPNGLLEIYEKHLLQIIKKPVGSSSDKNFSTSHLDEVLTILKEKSGNLLIGPGLGRSTETIQFVRQLLSTYDGNVVIDADALFAISEEELLEKPKSATWILTPHPGELKKLTGNQTILDHERLAISKELAQTIKCTIVSKGLPSLIIGETRAFMTGYDTQIFSRAGFGDVLAGKIAGFWLKEKNSELACIFALLDGKEKAYTYLENFENSLEPLDII